MHSQTSRRPTLSTARLSWRESSLRLREIGICTSGAGELMSPSSVRTRHQLSSSARADSVSGREHAVPERPVFAKLRIFRTAYIAGDDCAWDLAQGELKLFPDHCTTYYLTLLAVVAWLERRRQGECTRETRRELSVLDEVGARGLKAILTAEGFLT